MIKISLIRRPQKVDALYCIQEGVSSDSHRSFEEEAQYKTPRMLTSSRLHRKIRHLITVRLLLIL
jgi:hypothetical protein